MKVVAILVCAVLVTGAVWAAIELSPLFLNSRIELLGERNLPKIRIEKGGIIYCRMKADDFRFPLPPGSRAQNPTIVSGGFDTVDGSVEARFDGISQMSAGEYENWLYGQVQTGGQITAESVPGGLVIKFHYFGDR